jgi:hypothetical protein
MARVSGLHGTDPCRLGKKLLFVVVRWAGRSGWPLLSVRAEVSISNPS